MIILGITDHSTSGAALVVDGRATAAVNEERLVRSKMIMGFHGDLSRRVYIYLFIFCLIELKLETTRRPWTDSPLHLGEGYRRTPPGVI